MNRSNLLIIVLFKVMLLFSSVVWGQSEANKNTIPDALNRPALMVSNAANSTLLTVTRAGSRLVAAGERGIILISDDNGTSWEQSSVPTSVNLTTLYFIDDKNGWALGHMGLVLHSKDGGKTWVKQLDGIKAAHLAVEAVKDSSNKRAIEQANYLIEDGPDKPFFDIVMDADGNGLVVGAFNLAFSTNNGGESWTYLSPNIENRLSLHLYDINKIEDGYVIAGEQGLLLRSSDGGQSFKKMKSPYRGTWFGLHVTAQGTWIAYGLRGTVFTSQDQGESWVKTEINSKVSISTMTELSDHNIVLANQAGELLVSENDGLSFNDFKFLPGTPITSLVQSATGNLIVSSLRGVNRVAITQ